MNSDILVDNLKEETENVTFYEGRTEDDFFGRFAASTGSACSTGIPEPSHVLRAIGLSEEQAESSIRFSLGRNTTSEDISEAIDLIAEKLAELAKMELAQTA